MRRRNTKHGKTKINETDEVRISLDCEDSGSKSSVRKKRKEKDLPTGLPFDKEISNEKTLKNSASVGVKVVSADKGRIEKTVVQTVLPGQLPKQNVKNGKRS